MAESVILSDVGKDAMTFLTYIPSVIAMLGSSHAGGSVSHFAGKQTDSQSPSVVRTGNLDLIKDLLVEKFGKARIKLTEMPDDLRAMDIETDSTRPENLLTSLFFSANTYSRNSGESNLNLEALRDYQTTFWTKGDTVLNGETSYLVAYGIQGIQGFHMAPATEEPELQQRLILVSSIKALAPRVDLTKAGWLKLLSSEVPKNALQGHTRAISNLKQVAVGMIMYTNDNDDKYPKVEGTAKVFQLILPYVTDSSMMKTLNPNGGQIVFNMKFSGQSSASIPSPADTPIFFDSLPWPDGGRPVAFADGHVQYLTSSEWESKISLVKTAGIGMPLPQHK